jgi:uncharacterized protein (TIGR00251 family)
MRGTSEKQGFLTVREKDILLRVKAKPGAREDRIKGARGGELQVSVRASPEKGQANEGLIRLLAKSLGVPKADVVLKIGGGSAHKVFEVPLSARGALERLQRWGEGK